MINDSLAVIIHVPKTAGTTINSSLESLKLLGRSHCEAFIDNHAYLSESIGRCQWISGHVPYDKMRNALIAATDRPMTYFAAMRAPFEQVASHYNWLIEIHNRDAAFYNGHPEEIRAISKKIRRADNSDPGEIISILRSHPALFLNVQSRYILSSKFGDGAGAISGSLGNYARIGFEDTIDILLNEVAGSDARVVRDNVSPYHFDKSVFQTEEMVNFLKTHNAIDQKLYDAVRETWPN